MINTHFTTHPKDLVSFFVPTGLSLRGDQEAKDRCVLARAVRKCTKGSLASTQYVYWALEHHTALYILTQLVIL